MSCFCSVNNAKPDEALVVIASMSPPVAPVLVAVFLITAP